MSHDPQNAQIGREMANHINSTFFDRFWASILFLGCSLIFSTFPSKRNYDFFLKKHFLVFFSDLGHKNSCIDPVHLVFYSDLKHPCS